jgi:hypothetical protein
MASWLHMGSSLFTVHFPIFRLFIQFVPVHFCVEAASPPQPWINWINPEVLPMSMGFTESSQRTSILVDFLRDFWIFSPT